VPPLLLRQQHANVAGANAAQLASCIARQVTTVGPRLLHLLAAVLPAARPANVQHGFASRPRLPCQAWQLLGVVVAVVVLLLVRGQAGAHERP
jgi:hypothetical protein